MSATITIEITEDVRTPVRRHVHVPQSDQAVNDWFDLQKDQSTSVRLLIHDEIAKNGMVDRGFRHKFGRNPVVTTVGTGSVTQPAVAPAAQAPVAPAQAAAPQPAPAAAAAPAGPAPWTVPMVDPRDVEIARLRGEISRLEGIVGPFGPFLSDLARGDVLI